MPYVSRIVRQRQRWITLKEAISHISKAEICNGNAAWQQLRAALADGAVHASWALTETELDRHEPALPHRDIMPIYTYRELWTPASIDLEREFICLSNSIYPIDRVWVLKVEILELWSDEPVDSTAQGSLRQLRRSLWRLSKPF